MVSCIATRQCSYEQAEQYASNYTVSSLGVDFGMLRFPNCDGSKGESGLAFKISIMAAPESCRGRRGKEKRLRMLEFSICFMSGDPSSYVIFVFLKYQSA